MSCTLLARDMACSTRCALCRQGVRVPDAGNEQPHCSVERRVSCRHLSSVGDTSGKLSAERTGDGDTPECRPSIHNMSALSCLGRYRRCGCCVVRAGRLAGGLTGERSYTAGATPRGEGSAPDCSHLRELQCWSSDAHVSLRDVQSCKEKCIEQRRTKERSTRGWARGVISGESRGCQVWRTQTGSAIACYLCCSEDALLRARSVPDPTHERVCATYRQHTPTCAHDRYAGGVRVCRSCRDGQRRPARSALRPPRVRASTTFFPAAARMHARHATSLMHETLRSAAYRGRSCAMSDRLRGWMLGADDVMAEAFTSPTLSRDKRTRRRRRRSRSPVISRT